MTTLRFKVSVGPEYITVNKEDFADAWQEHCEENGDIGEGEDAGEPSAEFVLEQLKQEFEDGSRDLSETFETANVDVTPA